MQLSFAPTVMHKKLLHHGLVAVLVAAASSSAFSTSQYSGQEAREIKALSESDTAGLIAGKGMGFAKAAELNGYPGPAHVLELAAELKLSDEQLTQTRTLHAQMETEAKAAGRLLVDAERDLDTLFRERKATPELLTKSLGRVAELQARVRASHLQAHIAQAELLSAHQVARYNALRGYAGRSQESGHGSHHKAHH